MGKIKILAVVDYVQHLEIMRNFLEKAGFEIKITEDRDQLLQNINDYDVFLDYTHGGKLTDEQTESVIKFVEGGKALVGVHSAAVDKGSPKYDKLLGGKYYSHSEEAESEVHIVDTIHPITAGMKDFNIVDEIYALAYEPNTFQVLIDGKVNGVVYPICWIKEYGKGKVTFLSLGHGEQAFNNDNFQELVIRMIKWATEF
jgi:uncharacterized protein